MINISASKQVGPVYYMVKDVSVLEAIMKQNAIRTSLKAEPQSKGGSKYHYVSMMRDLTKADRNPGRWVYGIQIDGDKLSNRYRIQPYSYAGNAVKGNFFRVKTLTEYDNGEYVLSLVNWPTMSVSKEVFDEIENLILTDSQGLNQIKKLEIKENKRSYRGKSAVKQYNYDVKSGGLVIKEGLVSDSTLSYLLNYTNMDETEERIWILNDIVKFIDLRGCITGYIAPRGDSSVDQAIDEGRLPNLKVLYY